MRENKDVKGIILTLFLILIAMFASSAVFVQSAGAATITSTATGGTWSNASSWVGGVAPTSTDSAIIATTSGNSVTLGSNTTIVDVTINSGATLNNSSRTLTVTGNYTNNGTQSGTGATTLSGTNAIVDGNGSITNTGNFTLTNAKTINASANLTFGRISLSANTTVTNQGIVTSTNTANGIAGGAGRVWINAANSTLNVAGPLLTTGTLTATASPNTVNYNGAGQTVKATAYNNLVFSGSGAKSMASGTSVSGNLSIAPSGGGVTASVATGQTLSVNSLTLGGLGRINGTWGSTSSSATYKNNTYFATTTGIVTITVDTRITPGLSVTNSPVTYNGSAQVASVSAGPVAGSLSNVLYNGSGTVPRNVGTYAVKTDFTPTDATSYKSVTGASAGNFVINQATLTVTATTNTKTYDGTTSAAATPTITSGSLVGGDTATWTETYGSKSVGTGKNLIPSGIVSDGNGGNNYAVTFVSDATGAISAKALTVNATGINKGYDGATAATVTLVDNRVAGDVFVDNYTSATFAGKNVGIGKTVSVSGISISGADAGNYTANATALTTANITARAITVTAASNTKTYDGTTSAVAIPTITSGSLAAGDTASGTESYDNKNVGTGKTLTPSGNINDGDGGSNYNVALVNNTTGVVTAKGLAVTGITANNKVYDGNTTATLNTGGATLNGVVSGDTVNLDASGATGTFSDSLVGTGKTVTVSGLTISGPDAGNYTLTQPITAADITDTAPVFSVTSPASDSYINTATVGYTLSEAVASGKVTFTQTGGTADSSSPHIYTFTAPDMTSGSHSITTGLGLVNGAIYTVSFDAVDGGGYAAATVTNSNILYDASAATVTLNNPASGSSTNNTDVSYTLSKDIVSGSIVYTWTSGAADGGSPHSYALSGLELTAGSHTVTTGLPLVDGAVYTVDIENAVDLEGNSSAIVSNTNVRYDTTAVAITATLPLAGSAIKTADVSYTLSEQALSGKVTFTRTGGSPDINSPQVYTMSGTDLASGAHTIDTGLTLADGTIYTVSFDATDLAGNAATTVSNALVTVDTTAPVLSPVHIESNNADTSQAVVGDVVTVTFTSSEEITTPAVTIAGTVATVTGGPTNWSAAHTVVAGDAVGAVTFSISSFSDLAGNAGSTVSTTTDSSSVTKVKADPIVSAWPTAIAITYGQTLASSILTGGSASTGGTFAFTTPGTTPNAGMAPQGVTFTPTDTTNYNTVAGSVSVTVNKVTPTVTAWPTATAITYGQTLASSSLSGGSASTGGTFAFTTPGTAPNAGTAVQNETFTPTDESNYNTASGIVSVTVSKATVTPVITANNKTYDGTTAATLSAQTVTGILASDAGNVSLMATAANFGDKTVGNGKIVTATGLGLSGSVAGNYQLSSITAMTTADISKSTLTITATGINKIYDGATTASVTLSDNRFAGDVFTDSYTSANFADASVGTGKTVTVTGISISGGDAGNYDYNTMATTTADITDTAPSFSATSPAANSYINTTAVSYALSQAVASGAVTFVWSGGATDGDSPHVYTFAAPDMTSGSHSINTGFTLVNGATYTVNFDGVDGAGYATAEVSNANVYYDASAAVVTLGGPASGISTNNTYVTYSLSKDVISGDIVYTWTGGVADSGSPHTYSLSGLEQTSGSHTVMTGLPLVDGAVYTVAIENAVDLEGNSSAVVLNTGVRYDTTAVAITNTSPAAGSVIVTATAGYTLSEQALSGRVTFTWTGGVSDVNSPHLYNLSGSELIMGPQTIDTGFELIDGAFYTVSFDAVDLAGNPAATISNASVRFGNTAPTSSGLTGGTLNGMTFTFTDASTDPVTNSPYGITAVQVIWGDGVIDNGVHGSTFTHTYANTGTFTIRHSAGDAAGLWNTETRGITLTASNYSDTINVTLSSPYDSNVTLYLQKYLNSSWITQQQKLNFTGAATSFTVSSTAGSWRVVAYKSGLAIVYKTVAFNGNTADVSIP